MDQYVLILGLLGWITAFAIFAKAVLKRSKIDGVIRVNTNDPEKDTYTLELGIPFGELDERDEVVFKIEHE